MIHPNPPLLPEKTIRRAMNLSVSLLLDGAKAAGIALPGGGCAAAQIRPMMKQMKMAGTALTVRTQPGDNRPIHLAIYGARQPGYVLVIDGRAHEGCAYMGDLMLGACRALGFAGVVLDGMIRDRDGVEALGFPVYARGYMPLAPDKALDGEINAPVVLAGMHAAPGDLVMGDCDGVCAIPRADIDAVLAAAEKRQAYEAAREEAIAAYCRAKESGAPLPDLAPAWAREILDASPLGGGRDE